MHEQIRQTLSVLETVSSCVALLDAEGNVLGVNQAWQEREGQCEWFATITKSDVAFTDTLTHLDLLSPDQWNLFAEDCHRVLFHSVPAAPRTLSILIEGSECTISAHVTRGDYPEPCAAIVAIEFAEDSELQHVETIRAANVGLWDWDMVTNTVWYSPEWKKQIGFEDHEIGNGLEEWADRLHPDDREAALEKNRRFLEKLEPEYVHEFRLRHKDGSYRWIFSQGTLIVGDEGKAIRIRGYHIDITHLKATTQALRASEDRYQQIFEQTQVIKLLVDPRDGSIVDANKAASDYYGYTQDDLESMNLADINPLDKTTLLQSLDHVRVAGPQYELFQHRLKSGELRDVRVFRGCVSVDGRELIYKVVFDVTEQKQAEADRRLLMSAIEQSPYMIMILDTEGLVLYTNPASEMMTGFRKEDFLGKPFQLSIGTPISASQFEEICESLNAGKVWVLELMNVHIDGTSYKERVSISPVVDDYGNLSQAVVFRRDISKVSELENQLQQAQRMESIGRLAGGVAHDFNNMLSVILGYAGIAQKLCKPDDPLRGHMQEIIKAADRSSSLTRQLLAFARKQVISPQVVNINQSIDSTAKMLKRLIGETVYLECVLEDDLHPVKIDPGQVDQILANLCVNARDAISGQGRISIETENVVFEEPYVSGGHTIVPGTYVQIAVSDNGCGIEPENVSHIFDPFFTTKEVGEGTGLGLATIYGIVKQNEGFVHVYSELERGTTFRVYLPAHTAETQEESKHSKDKQELNGHETILLVEDEPSLLEMTQIILDEMGYKVFPAENASSALTLAQDHQEEIDLVLTDVIMPDMNGNELVAKLAKHYPNIRTLFMSGYTSNLIAEQGVLNEEVAFIQKPFTRYVLAKKLREVLDS